MAVRTPAPEPVKPLDPVDSGALHRLEDDGAPSSSEWSWEDRVEPILPNTDASGMFFPNRPQQFTGLDWQEVDLQTFAMIAGCLAMPFGVLQHGYCTAQKMEDHAVLFTRPDHDGNHERFVMRFPAAVKILLEPFEE